MVALVGLTEMVLYRIYHVALINQITSRTKVTFDIVLVMCPHLSQLIMPLDRKKRSEKRYAI